MSNFASYAFEFIRKRMLQKGHDDFFVDEKNITLSPESKRVIKATNYYLYIMGADAHIEVESDEGVYSPSKQVNFEQRREHSGNISIKNISTDLVANIEMLQISPKKHES